MTTPSAISKESKIPASTKLERPARGALLDLHVVPIESGSRKMSEKLADPVLASYDNRNEECETEKPSKPSTRTPRSKSPASGTAGAPLDEAPLSSKQEMFKIFGTRTENAAQGLAYSATLGIGDLGDDFLDFMFSMFRENRPRDAIEAMLITNMTLAHLGSAVAMNKVWKCKDANGSEAYSRIAARMSQGLITQMEALGRYRSSGQANMNASQVTVQEVGLAIVGSVKSNGI